MFPTCLLFTAIGSRLRAERHPLLTCMSEGSLCGYGGKAWIFQRIGNILFGAPIVSIFAAKNLPVPVCVYLPRNTRLKNLGSVLYDSPRFPASLSRFQPSSSQNRGVMSFCSEDCCEWVHSLGTKLSEWGQPHHGRRARPRS